MRDVILFSLSETIFLVSALATVGVILILRRFRDTLVARLTFLDLSKTTTRLRFDDNFHSFRASERYSIYCAGGSGSALRTAKRAINDDLKGLLSSNGFLSPEALFELWCLFGETPSTDGVFFNASGYARSRARYYAWRKRILLF